MNKLELGFEKQIEILKKANKYFDLIANTISPGTYFLLADSIILHFPYKLDLFDVKSILQSYSDNIRDYISVRFTYNSQTKAEIEFAKISELSKCSNKYFDSLIYGQKNLFGTYILSGDNIVAHFTDTNINCEILKCLMCKYDNLVIKQV